MDYKLENNNTGSARGHGTKIKEEIRNGNQMIALRSQTGKSHHVLSSG